MEWLNEPKADSVDFEHYRIIYRFLLSDFYDWVGQVRTVSINKKGTWFTLAENIEDQAELIFRRLKDCNYFKGLLHDEFVKEIVDFYCVTNQLHPFREGTGRTWRASDAIHLSRRIGNDADKKRV